jgi:hypothetical protein
MAKQVTTLSDGTPFIEVMRVWRSLEALIMKLNETDVWNLYQFELANGGRHLFLQRLYGRFTRLRAAREVADLKAATRDN